MIKIKKLNNFINESYKYDNNKIVLLIEFNMMNDNWTAFTPDSYSSYLFHLTDEEINEFYSKSEEEINQIVHDIEKFVEENKD